MFVGVYAGDEAVRGSRPARQSIRRVHNKNELYNIQESSWSYEFTSTLSTFSTVPFRAECSRKPKWSVSIMPRHGHTLWCSRLWLALCLLVDGWIWRHYKSDMDPLLYKSLLFVCHTDLRILRRIHCFGMQVFDSIYRCCSGFVQFMFISVYLCYRGTVLYIEAFYTVIAKNSIRTSVYCIVGRSYIGESFVQFTSIYNFFALQYNVRLDDWYLMLLLCTFILHVMEIYVC